MTSLIPAPIARQPWAMLVPLIVLVCFGTTVLYSVAGEKFGVYAQSHIIRFVIFLAMAFVIARMPRSFVVAAAYPAYVAVLVLLVLVEALGAIGGGSQRWLQIGPFVLQPSEFMKPVIVLVLARFYDTLPTAMTQSWRALIPAGGLMVLPFGLVLLQPDLGTGLAIVFGGAVVVFLAGLPLWWFLSAGAAAMIAAPIAFFFALHDYQRQRVLTFLDPESDPLGTGYHITQSKIAIGSGGLFGKGFGNGSQSHLNYLPEPHTDFVFATMAEEWGLLGGLVIIICFALILRWGRAVARQSQDRFGSLLASGMVATVFFYMAINLSMVMGLAPVVGIPLPFMSHGGSSMLTNMICLGTLMMVNNWNRSSGRSGF
jgi:rod shape determining protein RodA